MADIRLPAHGEARVLLKDTDKNLDRKFTLRVLTRSVKRDMRAKAVELADAEKDLSENEVPSDEQEERIMRLTCDLISLLLDPGKGDLEAGDMLFDGWMADRVTDEQITGLLTQLNQAGDPT